MSNRDYDKMDSQKSEEGTKAQRQTDHETMLKALSPLFPPPPTGDIQQQQQHQQQQKKKQQKKKRISNHDKILLCSDAPSEYGLLITLKEEGGAVEEGKSESSSSPMICRFEFVQDQSLSKQIQHPHAFGPCSLKNLKALSGGGSGVMVFEGHDMASREDLVMKHGSHSDTKELFALAKISKQLQIRGGSSTTNNEEAAAAAQHLQTLLPSFRMIYISPRHLWKRPTVPNQMYKFFKDVVVNPISTGIVGPITTGIINNNCIPNINSDGNNNIGKNVNITIPKNMLNLKDRMIPHPFDVAGSTTTTSSSTVAANEGTTFSTTTAAATATLQSSTMSTTSNTTTASDYGKIHATTRSIPSKPFPSAEDLGNINISDVPSSVDSNAPQSIEDNSDNNNNLREQQGSSSSLSGTPLSVISDAVKGVWSTFTSSGGENIAAASSRPSSNSTIPSSDGGSGSSSDDNETKKTAASNESSSAKDDEEPNRLRKIKLFAESGDLDILKISPHMEDVAIYLGNETKVLEDSSTSLWYGLPHEGYDCLENLVLKLQTAQKQEGWKFTLGQTKIGGMSSPKTASKYLSEGLLEGELLTTLIDQEIQLIRNLQALTPTTPTSSSSSQKVVEQIKIEINQKIDHNESFNNPMDISDMANEFVGKAIKKNWDPKNGRFITLHYLGYQFRQHQKRPSSRSSSFILMKEEKLPAMYLGMLLQDNAKMGNIFVDPPAHCTPLGSWKDLLRSATSLKSHAATTPIWNCGISDGGLHNMFLNENQIWLFDLGEPISGQPVSAFLTKFLFSFFHTLGMVDTDTDDGSSSTWVNRFRIPTSKGEKLDLTDESKKLIPKAYSAFKITLDRLVEEVFEGEHEVRDLLISYVTLQLLSDAAFCLERWTIKGGGRKRNKNHHKHIEKWLWRCLWDVYIASDLSSKTKQRYLSWKVIDRRQSKP